MASLTGIRLIEGMVLNGGVYFAGQVVYLLEGEAGDLVRAGKATPLSPGGDIPQNSESANLGGRDSDDDE